MEACNIDRVHTLFRERRELERFRREHDIRSELGYEYVTMIENKPLKFPHPLVGLLLKQLIHQIDVELKNLGVEIDD